MNTARAIQLKYNHGLVSDKESSHVAEVMSYLELFMRSVKQTFLTYKQTESILLQDKFHNFVRTKLKELYSHTMGSYGHLINDINFHSSHGSGDLANPYGLYD